MAYKYDGTKFKVEITYTLDGDYEYPSEEAMFDRMIEMWSGIKNTAVIESVSVQRSG